MFHAGSRTSSLLLVALLTCPFSTLPASQEEAPPSPAPAESAEQAPEAESPSPLEIPATVEAAVEVEPEELEEALASVELPRRREVLEGWMALVRAQEAAFQKAMSAEEGSAARQTATRIGSDRDALIARAEVALAAVANANGEVDRERAAIAGIRQSEAKELDRVSTVPSDQAKAQSLDLEILRAELRPLTKSQVAEQLTAWLALLQKKCIEVRKVEVAALESEDAAEIEKYNTRAVELRGERGRLIERVKVVIDSLEAKGGDVDDARDYVKSVVVAPPITGWRAALTTSQAWMMSGDGGLDLAARLGTALAIVLVFWVIARTAARVTARALRSMKRTSELLREFLIGSVKKSLIFIGILVALGRLGLDMGPLLAAIGAAGLVIGFALQGTLSNFASGIMIMIYRPFDVGDVISAAGTSGKVMGMNLVTTLVRTFDNQSIFIPNNKVWGDVITNVTANPTRRVDMKFGIGYGDDVERARDVLLEVVSAHEKVLADPAPIVRVSELGDSSVNFIVRPWSRTEDYWEVFWDLTREVKTRFDAEGISIPFPQRDLHVHHVLPEGDAWLRPPQAEPGAERTGSEVPRGASSPR